MSGLVQYEGSDDDSLSDNEEDNETGATVGLVGYTFDANKSGKENGSSHVEIKESKLSLPRAASSNSLFSKDNVEESRVTLLRNASSAKNLDRASPLVIARNHGASPVPSSPSLSNLTYQLNSPAITPNYVQAHLPQPTTTRIPVLKQADLSLLPSASTGVYPAGVEDRVQRLLSRKKSGMDVNAQIATNKKFRNPSIYDSLVSHTGLQETGSNYPTALYDPKRWKPKDFYTELASAQRHYEERRAQARAQRSEVAFTAASDSKRLKSDPVCL